MWELIKLNQRKSFILFIGMGMLLLVLGWFVGASFVRHPDAGFYGVMLAAAVWLLLSLVSYFAGSSILLTAANAKQVDHNVHPRLHNIVEEMKISANLPAMPKVYIINDPAPNAFATGISPEKSSIAVTAGLLSRLNRDELQGVVAHEMSHIINRDVLFMTFAGVMLGSIALISQVFLRSMWFSGGGAGRYRSSSRSSGGGGGQAQIIIMIAAIVLAILAPILARMFYFAISRKREYLADASAVRLTRYPEGLASALEKIANSPVKMGEVDDTTAPMYIENPSRKASGSGGSMFSTHPPINERIKILRAVAHGANYLDYQNAFAAVSGKKDSIIPGSGLKESEAIPLRKASPSKARGKSAKSGARDLGDLMHAVNNYAFLVCACGLKMKIPPETKNDRIDCPRCGRINQLPVSELAAAAIVLDQAAGPKKKPSKKTEAPQIISYKRKSRQWESFACACGKNHQLSPSFEGDHLNCKSCGRKIMIEKV